MLAGQWVTHRVPKMKVDRGHSAVQIDQAGQFNGVDRITVHCECGKKFSGVGMGPQYRWRKHREQMIAEMEGEK